MGNHVPLTYAGRLFIFNYHLKGQWNSNYSSWHVQRRLFSMEYRLLIVWKVQFCGTVPPPVLEVDA